MKTYLINCITSFDTWEKYIKFFIEKSDKFEIVFQGKKDDLCESELNGGKREFLLLRDITVVENDSMVNSIKVIGSLTNCSRELFLKYLTPSFIGDKPILWSFNLFLSDKSYLSLNDFTVCLIHITDEVEKELVETGFNILDLDIIDEKPLDEDVTFLSFTDEELKEFGDGILK